MSKSGGDWALVTGAYSGIGLELCRLLARDGHSIVLVARDEERLRAAAAELKGLGAAQTYVISADLAEPGSPERIVKRLKDQNIKVDVLINNAGFDVYGPFVETDMAAETRMLLLNILALTQLTKLLLPRMIHRKRGRILLLGSVVSFIPSPNNAVYSATKAYVLSFGEALAEELRRSGVSVTTLCPGATRTEFHQRADMENIRILKFSWERADKVALAGYRAMQRGQPLVLTGGFNKLTMFLGNFIPRRWKVSMAKYMLARV